jgi:uncharacterized protein DUF885
MRERLAVAVERYDAGDTTSELNVTEGWVQYVGTPSTAGWRSGSPEFLTRCAVSWMRPPARLRRPAHRIEVMIAPTNDGGIWYTPPSEDWSRPGRMWWSVPDGLETFSTWKEVTTVHHEGMPSHHLQVSQAIAGRDSLNRWQRLLCWVPGHGEGWAVYAERLMGELGYLDDHGLRLGLLDSQLMSTAIVAHDIGVRLELEIPKGKRPRGGLAASSASRISTPARSPWAAWAWTRCARPWPGSKDSRLRMAAIS